jgi:hypothetical protein
MKKQIKSYVFIWDCKDEVPWFEMVSLQKQYPELKVYEDKLLDGEGTTSLVCFALSKRDAMEQIGVDFDDSITIKDVREIEYHKNS